ncbi:MAG: hypothetical protein JJV98_21590 [Desulfosarcina sp.]|nr:hypothetical protein [Desulfobacterales bacterium]
MIIEAPLDTHIKPIPNWEEKRNRCFADRRSGVERRKFYSIDYFMSGGKEKRAGDDRRSGIERRKFWERDGWPCIARNA